MIVQFNVRDFLDRAEFAYPDRTALVDEPDQPAAPWDPVTFRELAERARAQAAGLDRLGVGRGERVAVVSQNSSRLLTSFFGVCGWGRVLVPINFRLAPAEVAYIVDHSGASVLLVDPELDEALAEVGAPHRFVLGTDSDPVLFPRGEDPRPWESDEGATATINYTSGTTASSERGAADPPQLLGERSGPRVARAALRPRRLPAHVANVPRQRVGSCPGRRSRWRARRWSCARSTAPRSSVASSGATSPFSARRPRWSTPCSTRSATWDRAVPGRDVTRIVVAGAPPPSRTIERIESELGWEFIQLYGLTETAPVLTFNRRRPEWDDLPSAERARKLMRAGAPAVGTEVSIDTSGEVLARSNTVMEGYWRQPGESEQALAGGWFHTGDGGQLDEEGHLSILDRKKDVIITGGENVSSIEVEDAIFSLGGVAEVAVIGIPDETWGEKVIAARRGLGRRGPDRGPRHRPLPRGARRVQVSEAGRVPRGPAPHCDGEAPEVPAACSLLGGTRPPGALTPHVASPWPGRPGALGGCRVLSRPDARLAARDRAGPAVPV